MAYDKVQLEQYTAVSSAFGATTETQTHIGPKGKKGLVIDIEVDLTADNVGTTTVPEITVGLTSGSTEYARYRLGTAAGTGYLATNTPFRATQEALSGEPNNRPPHLSDYAGHVALETTYLPADTKFIITRLAGVGGTPAGTGRSTVWIAWF